MPGTSPRKSAVEGEHKARSQDGDDVNGKAVIQEVHGRAVRALFGKLPNVQLARPVHVQGAHQGVAARANDDDCCSARERPHIPARSDGRPRGPLAVQRTFVRTSVRTNVLLSTYGPQSSPRFPWEGPTLGVM